MSEGIKIKAAMSDVRSPFEEKDEPGSWRDALLAGLPHLLVTLFGGVSQLAYGLMPSHVFPPYGRLFTLLGVAFFILAGGVVMYVWRRGWPRRSASWYGYAVLLVIGALAYLNRWLGIIKGWKFNNAVILGGLALTAVGYFWLVGRDRLKGLLVTLFLLPMIRLLMSIEFVPPHIEGLVFVGAGLITTLAAAAILRLGSWRAGVWLALRGNLLSGLAISYVSVYQIDVPARYYSPTPVKVATHWAMHMLATAALVIAPVLLWALWDLGKRSGQTIRVD